MSERNDKLKEVAPHIWSMYQHIMEGRASLENRLNYFLAIDTLLLYGFLQLFQQEVKTLSLDYIIPCVLLVVPILLLLANFLGRQMRGAWIEFDHSEFKLKDVIDSDKFYIHWVADMYSCAEGSGKYRKRVSKLLRLCISCVAGSLAWLFVLMLWSISGKLALLSVVAVAAGVLTFLVPERLRDFPYREREMAIRDDLIEWLNNPKVSGNERA